MTGANMQCITTAEQKHLDEQAEADAEPTTAAAAASQAHISLAA